jgi:signal transduction histidine kinase
MGQGPRRRLALLVALTAAYFLAGRLGLSLAFVHASASAVWPPAGIALAAILLLGPSVWVAVFAGAFLVNLSTSGSLLASIGIAAGNTAEALVGAWLVRRVAGGATALRTAPDVFRFAAVAGVATTMAATVGVASLSAVRLVPAGAHAYVWLTWWLGDLTGIVLFAPLFLVWGPRAEGTPRRPSEIAVFLATVAVMGIVVFVWSPIARGRYPVQFLSLPVLLWGAFRLGPRATALGCALLAALAVWGTVLGLGPFGRFAPNEALLLLQSFMGVVASTMLAAAAEVAARRAREAEVRRLNAVLEQRVAERTAARREAEEANRMKDAFLASLSHELRTPINAVLGWAHMLMKGQVADASRARAIETIYRNAVAQQRLVSDILDVSQITAGTLQLNVAPVSLAALAESALDAARPSAVARRMTLAAEIDPSLPAIAADEQRLSQVVANLLDNAIKFSPEGGRVSLRVARGEGGVELTVEDNGPGIAPRFLPHIFEQFRQADASTTREHGGLGLGLAIVRRIVELHGGSVTAANRPGGSGAVFTVRLPAGVTALV